MVLTGEHIIGETTSSKGQPGFQAINPATGSALPTTFFEASEAEVDEATKAAHAAFLLYKQTDRETRAQFLNQIADEIMALDNTLIERAMQETGLPEGRLVGERGRTVNQLRLFASVVREGSWMGARIDTAQPDRQPAPKPDVRCMNVAMGPVAVFGASNFPLAFSVAGGDTASALAAGCPVIVKAHPAHPGTSELVGKAIQQAIQKSNMPRGTFSLLQGKEIAVGQALVKHPLVKAVGFTGSLRGGRALYDLAAARPEPIPVYAEMGSTNPVFILPQALQELRSDIAKGLVQSTTLGVGQFCTNPGLVFGIDNSDWNDFMKMTQDLMAQEKSGTMLHAGIKNNYQQGISTLSGIEEVEILSEGHTQEDAFCQGTPMLLKSSGYKFLADQHLEEEVFGPSTLLITCENRSQLLNTAQKLSGHLTATIHATPEELEDYSDLIEELTQKAGRVIFNGFPTGVEVCHAMVHGGPYPATTDSRTTSVGTMAIFRFLRPVSYQNLPDKMLPDALKNANPLGIWRLTNGSWSNGSL